MAGIGHVVKFMQVQLGSEVGEPGDVECAVTAATLTPSVSTQTSTTACPDGVITDAAPATWTFDLSYNTQETATALSTLLVLNEGDTVTVEWVPNTAEPTFGWTFDVVLIPGTLGYPVGQFAAGQVSLPVVGKPALLP